MRVLRVLLALIAALVGAAPAAAAELVTIETPSAHVDPAKVRFNGADHPRRLLANVLLPDGYDGRRRFPVLYLLHGVGDSYASWARASHGDIARVAQGLPAIVVMPEAAAGFYANWWNGGRRGDPGWERFFLDELVPLVEQRFRVLPGRRWRAIAGLSMGGLGATFLAGQLPGYFGSAATFSGFVQHQRQEAATGLQLLADVAYEDIFGPVDGFYATGHNPTRLAGNLRWTRLHVAVGDGAAQPGVQSSPSAVTSGGAVEAELRIQSEELVAAAREAGVDVTYRPQGGVHDWPYWRRHLRDAIAWDLFAPVPDEPQRWTYRTVAQHGEAWGLRYSFAEAPAEVVTLSREGGRLRGDGSGTVTLRNGAGCAITVALPFDAAPPASTCGRLRVSVAPRRVRLGRSARLRVRVLREVDGRRFAVAGARVVLGRLVRRTDDRGRARLRYAPRGRAGLRSVRVSARGLRSATARVRVVR